MRIFQIKNIISRNDECVVPMMQNNAYFSSNNNPREDYIFIFMVSSEFDSLEGNLIIPDLPHLMFFSETFIFKFYLDRFII